MNELNASVTHAQIPRLRGAVNHREQWSDGLRSGPCDRKPIPTPKQLEQEATVERIRQAREAEANIVLALPDDLKEGLE